MNRAELIDWLLATGVAQQIAASRSTARATELEKEDPIMAAEYRGMAAGFESSGVVLSEMAKRELAS